MMKNKGIRRYNPAFYFPIFLISVIICFSSCTGTKKLAEGKYLYGGAKIDLKSKANASERKIIEHDLNSILKPKPNSKFTIPLKSRKKKKE